MVRMDWDRVLGIKAESLTDDEIEDLFPMVIRCDVDDVDNIENLRALIKLSQEILQHKDNQVESLLLECDELKEKVSSALSPSTKSLRKSSQVIDPDEIERDNSESKPTDFSVNDNYRETIKNDKIKSLTSEIEALERENEVLKEKLDSLKDEMEDATEKMDEMTGELEQLRSQNTSYKDHVEELERENSRLLTQIDQVPSEHIEKNGAIDDFGAAIEERVAEWKDLLEQKNAEIGRLEAELSRTTTQSMTSARQHNKSQVLNLSEEIDRRQTIIADLQSKLLEATTEINESAALIEELKIESTKLNKTGRRKEHRDLMKRILHADETITNLEASLRLAEEELTLKSQQLCETLATLRKYEDKERGLTEAIREIKATKEQLLSKGKHIQDLISVINNLEELNSRREMQILTLREKLDMPDDEEISMQGVASKIQEEARVRNKLMQKNEALEQENSEMKSDIKRLRHKICRLGEKLHTTPDTIDTKDAGEEIARVIGEKYREVADEDLVSLQHRAEMDDIKDNVRIVIEENEALRKGMHEILDSIHDQDGKSAVEVQSDTLERLLEALDVRHIAGWYHPAMRLQERLNVVQGSNSELRLQLKQIRKELHKKDDLLRKVLNKSSVLRERFSSTESEREETKIHVAEIDKIQRAYRDESEKWQIERDSLTRENEALKDSVERLTARLEVLDRDMKIIESGEDDVKKSFATKSRECAESMVKVVVAIRKCAAVEKLLEDETAKAYRNQKEAIDSENAFRKALVDMNERNKRLENEILTLQSNLVNSISVVEFNELKEKYEESSMNLRAIYESQLVSRAIEEIAPNVRVSQPHADQHSTNLESLHEIAQCKLEKCEAKLQQLTEINTELRRQLIDLQKELSQQIRPQKLVDEEKSKPREELEEKLQNLAIENENLSRTLEITREEAQMHYTANSLKTFELDSLRHQILDLQAVSEDKDTIARLGFELTNCRAAEIELSQRKVQLENDIIHLRDDLVRSNERLDETRSQLQDCRKICSNRCRSYEDLIDFMRCQYAGSTSVTALQRFDSMLKHVIEGRAKIARHAKEANDLKESSKLHQELLNNRLEVVERLKAILEDKIGSSHVESMMQSFSETSQHTLNDIRLKRRITQLESELKNVNAKIAEYESTIVGMECEMMNIQRIWCKKPGVPSSVSDNRMETQVATVEKRTVYVEARVESQSVEIQSEPYDFYAKTIVPETPKKKEAPKMSEMPESSGIPEKPKTPEKPEMVASKEIEAAPPNADAISILEEQLNEALALASKRSAILIKYEAQITEFEAKIIVLEKTIVEKDSQLARTIGLTTDRKKSIDPDQVFKGTDKAALKSTINSLQKMVNQKEETISRYQNLLKDDRDEHSKAASQFQDEIKGLREEIQRLQDDAEIRRETSPYRLPVTSGTVDEPVKEPRPDIEAEEKIARLCEQVSTLEADLGIAKELGERWHRLAEERLHHMDHMRQRLEEQHKNELESYRLELNKWQSEADTLRQQLSENRMQLTKGNISLVKELQERDNKIHELTVACQQLQSEFEMMETMTLSQPVVVHGTCSTKMQEMAQALSRDQANHFQSELDLLRRQIKSQTDREKIYKDQIADLKQQLSRRYMAVKTEERRISNREMQLERKLKTLEDELHNARIRLDKEYRAQEAKRIKTAEELSLWEKQKKWQQIAEKLRKELKDKGDECKKLNTNYEKLRAVVACMEREKWYLRSKLRSENGSVANGSANELHYKIVDNLQIECQTLRDRVKDLTDRLESEDSCQLLQQLESQKSRVTALEVVAKGNTYVIDQLEKLEKAKSSLEKANIRLESENFELRMEMEKRNLDTPRLREKVEHLEKYVELLKVEKSSESSPRSLNKDSTEPKKSIAELEKTVFILKRVVEKLQAENKRLKTSSKTCHRVVRTERPAVNAENTSVLQRQYEHAQKRVVALEADLQLAEQRIIMLEDARKEDENNGDVGVLKQQLAHKSELLDKVKQLLTRAAINEKALRQRIQQIEMKQTLSTIPECSVKFPPSN